MSAAISVACERQQEILTKILWGFYGCSKLHARWLLLVAAAGSGLFCIWSLRNLPQAYGAAMKSEQQDA